MDLHGMIDIPALHDAASDQPIQFTPVCSGTAIPVCLNPAYASSLPVTASALAPLLSQLAGLPGAPARIAQAAATYHQGTGNSVVIRPSGPRVSGAPPVFHLVLPDQLAGPPMTARQLVSQVATTNGPQLVATVIGDGPGASRAQNAVAAALMLAAGQGRLNGLPQPPAGRGGSRLSRPPGARGGRDAAQPPGVAPGTPAYAAAVHFAGLPAPVRHAWLVQHLPALRAGHVTLAQLP
jgi:hypothetical protein